MKDVHSRAIRYSAAVLAALITTTASVHAETAKPPSDWNEWAEWAEQLGPISDSDGHGPDIGSDEWTNAMDRRLGITDPEGHGPDLKSEEWKSAVERKLQPSKLDSTKEPEPKEERKHLSTHDTLARFIGIRDHRCQGRTALCPDRCGHSGKLARFEILKYLAYRKPGEYGDPKQKEFTLLMEDNQGTSKIPASAFKAIEELKPGDTVRLKWNHDYVTREGSSFPERNITDLRPDPSLGDPD